MPTTKVGFYQNLQKLTFFILSFVNLYLMACKERVQCALQGYNARKVNCSCVHIETSSLWAEFVNKNRGISVPLVEEDKSIEF